MTRTRGGRRAGLALSGAALALGWAALPAQAARVDDRQPGSSATVANSGEAWYAAAPVDLCTTPLGCPPPEVPSSPYPADTLHVGVAGGQESARTYLVPDLSSVPYGASVTAVAMTLPVATAPGDGTVAPESAHIAACLATAPATDGAEGSTAAPPEVDCTPSAPLRYDAGKALFTADLTALVSAAGGVLPYGVALVPDGATAVTDTWHVTFNGRERAGGDHISSRVTFLAPSTPDGTVTDGTAGGDVVDQPPAAEPAAEPGPVGLPDAGEAPAAEAPPQVAPPAAPPVAQPVAFSHEFQYPMAFLLPLVLLAGAVFFGRLFTRDATPVGHRAAVGP